MINVTAAKSPATWFGIALGVMLGGVIGLTLSALQLDRLTIIIVLGAALAALAGLSSVSTP